MHKRPLGKTGMHVTALGFGGAEIGYEQADQRTVDALLAAALDAGLNIIDTAECYLDSEELIGRAVAHRRGELFLFTKCGHDGPAFGAADWDPAMLCKSIDRSLQRLRTNYVDLLQLHSCDLTTLQRGEVVRVVQDARAAGKTRFLGYSGDGAAARWAVGSGFFDTLQTSVSVCDQEAIDLTIPLAVQRGVGVIAKRPLANAVWRYASFPDVAYHQDYYRRWEKLAYDFADPAETALRFVLTIPGIATAVAGTTKPTRWRANAALAEKGPLPWSEYDAIRTRWRQVAPAEWVGQT